MIRKKKRGGQRDNISKVSKIQEQNWKRKRHNEWSKLQDEHREGSWEMKKVSNRKKIMT